MIDYDFRGRTATWGVTWEDCLKEAEVAFMKGVAKGFRGAKVDAVTGEVEFEVGDDTYFISMTETNRDSPTFNLVRAGGDINQYEQFGYGLRPSQVIKWVSSVIGQSR